MRIIGIGTAREELSSAAAEWAPTLGLSADEFTFTATSTDKTLSVKFVDQLSGHTERVRLRVDKKVGEKMLASIAESFSAATAEKIGGVNDGR